MFNSALPHLRGASRIQARSLLRPSTRHARDVMASAARGRHEKRSHGSQQSNKSSGQGPRHNGRPPLRSTAVAGFSVLAALAKSNDPKPLPPLPPPSCAFKDPSGWEYMNTDPSLYQDYYMRIYQAFKINSIEEARSAHFEYTRSILQFCVHGEIIEEGSLPNDVVFGMGHYAAKEDTKIFWMASPVQDTVPILCLSVHHDLSDEWQLPFAQSAIVAGLGASFFEKFKENETYAYIHIHTPTKLFWLRFHRDEVSHLLERSKAWAVQKQRGRGLDDRKSYP
ncbi:hypothetical protein LA080_016164 [Diaporthe eres]|uniref:Uncharacterized protein n=1 Tax=Diaporthe vaccinii TaxID=105482 RepID=A0ABR4E0J0_9PEZI|nr:hypothetical protein LA080_016164 [Diaporthe eres]